MLGMYIHTHWSYRHPYAARTWTVADWEGYLGGLSALGYDSIMVWPLLDSMPARPEPSDRAFLGVLSAAIDLAHERFGMHVTITAAPNTMGNAHAADYAFEERPYFVCEKKVNPRDPAEVERFLQSRREHFASLANADALAVIDSDPGGYIGSTNDEFVMLMQGQIEAFRSANPSGELIYWMLAGWESYNRFWADQQTGTPREMWDDWNGSDFVDTLTMVRDAIPDPWSVYAWLPQHKDALEQLGLTARAMYFPYATIEGEPTFPLTNCNPDALASALSPSDLRTCPRGVMANAQTHCLQLPHTYLFAQLAKGERREDLDLTGFAEQLFPGHGKTLAQAWRAIETGTPEQQRALAAAARKARGAKPGTGAVSGLLFGDADRFLIDLALNLEIRASLTELKRALDANQDASAALAATLEVLLPYQERVGFVDAYGGPLHSDFNQQLARLGDPSIDATLKLFSDWREPAVRNGLCTRLLRIVTQYCQHKGVF